MEQDDAPPFSTTCESARRSFDVASLLGRRQGLCVSADRSDCFLFPQHRNAAYPSIAVALNVGNYLVGYLPGSSSHGSEAPTQSPTYRSSLASDDDRPSSNYCSIYLYPQQQFCDSVSLLYINQRDDI